MKKCKISIILVSLLFFIGGSSQNQTKAEKINGGKDPNSTYLLLDLFGDVFERVRSSYVTKVSDEKLIEAAITGMLSSLDPHSSYLNTKKFQDMRVQTRGKFGGLGIEVTMEGGLVKVVSPIDDTPAFKAGIKSGDLISHLNDEKVQGLTLSEAVEKMRGKGGQDIKITILRKGQKSFSVIVTRDVIPIRTVRSKIEKNNIGYIRISSFSQPTGDAVVKAIKKIKQRLGDKLVGLVIDLRNNPGGLLDQAIAVSDSFLEKGEIVSTRSRRKEDHQRYNAKPGDIAEGKPIVVLINGGSASASEIVAGALQDHKRAIILGTKSFGKGSVQTIIPIREQGAMRLTTARYYTPSGKSIQEIGVSPDIEVERVTLKVDDKKETTREGDLRGALKNDNNKNNIGGKEAPKKLDNSKTVVDPNSKLNKTDNTQNKTIVDYQLKRARDLIHAITLISKVSDQ